MEQYGARAREVFDRTASDAVWNRTGLTTWCFGNLPQFVVRQVAGTAVRLYPALVARDDSVDLTLMQSEQAALEATRGGLRRLLALATARVLSVLAKRASSPFPQALGLPPSRAAREAFGKQVLSRVVDEAFALRDFANYPRGQSAFEALLAAGTPRLQATFDRLSRAIAAASAELEQTRRVLANAVKQPSGTRAARDIQDQLAQLFSADLLADIELVQLEQYPRYLKAAQTRLARAIVDPRKDAEKLSPLAPLWAKFLQVYSKLEDQSAARALRWAFEELRVAIFAPELKPAFPVSTQSLARELEALSSTE
jgi:ATP-dependent helicase HrpA